MSSTFIAMFAIGAAFASWRFVPLSAWTLAFPSLLTALSLMGGAVLVRLARNAPITSPSTFNDEDLSRFFDTLEALSARLLWIFVQTITAMFVTIASIVLVNMKSKPNILVMYIEPLISGLMAFLLIWLVWRLLLMARGDIGFLRLQRKVLENALLRDRRKHVEELLDQSALHRSPGEYGRALEPDRSL